ncbi:MAG: PTS sugar transporter subunit IIB [Coprobacillaceae bacterium]
MKLMLSCIGGISTTMLVERIKVAAKERSIDVEVWSVPETMISEEIGKFDVLLVSMPVNKDRVEKLLDGKYPIESIELGEYTTLDANSVLDHAIRLYKDFYNKDVK